MRPVHRLVDRRLVKTLVMVQAMMVVIVALLAGLLLDRTVAVSAGLGALVYWLAGVFFAWQTFKSSGATASKKIVSGMYVGLAGKFAIVTLGLLAIFLWVRPLSMLAVVIGFACIQMTSWVVPIVLLKRTPKTV